MLLTRAEDWVLRYGWIVSYMSLRDPRASRLDRAAHLRVQSTHLQFIPLLLGAHIIRIPVPRIIIHLLNLGLYFWFAR